MIQQEEQPIDIVPPEKIAFIAYNIGVYETYRLYHIAWIMSSENKRTFTSLLGFAA